MRSAPHLLWIPAAAGIGLVAAYALGDFLTLPVDLYYLACFVIVYLFLGTYARRTGLNPLAWARRRLGAGGVAPVAGPLAHVLLHVTAVLHAPRSYLYCPRTAGRAAAPARPARDPRGIGG